ncbi:MAG: hemerythrin domain-containing protein [Planctomycetota bacterium]
MKRDPRLRDLSEDHHHGLVLARVARRAAHGEGGLCVATAWRRVAREFAAELEPHFEIEERLLVPALRRVGATDFAGGVEADHAALRALVARADSATREDLAAFGDRLERHVRYEEREVFEFAQERLDAAELEAIAAATARRPPRTCRLDGAPEEGGR